MMTQFRGTLLRILLVFAFAILFSFVWAEIATAQIPGDPACDGENGTPPPYCRRLESCQQYGARLAAPCINIPPSKFIPSGRLCEYRIWERWWCSIGGGRCHQTTGRRIMRPYFEHHWHGCSCQGSPQVPGIGPGDNHPCWSPDPTIFRDDFESGNLSKWSNRP